MLVTDICGTLMRTKSGIDAYHGHWAKRIVFKQVHTGHDNPGQPGYQWMLSPGLLHDGVSEEWYHACMRPSLLHVHLGRSEP